MLPLITLEEHYVSREAESSHFAGFSLELVTKLESLGDTRPSSLQRWLSALGQWEGKQFIDEIQGSKLMSEGNLEMFAYRNTEKLLKVKAALWICS
jgi:hypothetical protein